MGTAYVYENKQPEHGEYKAKPMLPELGRTHGESKGFSWEGTRPEHG